MEIAELLGGIGGKILIGIAIFFIIIGWVIGCTNNYTREKLSEIGFCVIYVFLFVLIVGMFTGNVFIVALGAEIVILIILLEITVLEPPL